jgi:predicted transcriptional regulator
VLDPNKTGFEKVLQDYQIAALKVVWKNKDGGVTSRDVYLQSMEDLEGVRTISRASIINFLNSMCDEGVLSYDEETCKGGTRSRCSSVLNEEGYVKYIARSVIESLLKDFPEQTAEALREALGS